MRGDHIALVDAGFDAADIAEVEMVQWSGRRQEAAGRIFRIKPRFDGVAVDEQLFLLQRDRLAARHAQLPFDQVDPGDLLGHRMLDLQPRVHFHEEDAVGAQAFAGVGDEFDRARAFVVHRFGRAHGGGADFLARCLVHARGGGFLDHLLVAALQRAIALEQVDDIAVAVAEHLHLDMAGRGDPLFQQHFVVGEAGLGLALARFAASASKSSALSTLRMPLPPPPATALISTG